MINKKIIVFSIFIAILYYFMYMSPLWIMSFVNNPYTNSMFLLFFHNEEVFSLLPLFNISFNVFYGYAFLLCIPLVLSFYAYFKSK